MSMSRLVFLPVAAAFALSAAAASAQPVSSVQSSDPTAAKTAITGDPNRRVCRSLAATGSRLSRAKICKTAREWAEQQYEGKKELERIQTRPNLPDAG
jgi:hypothetical protein